MLGTRFVGNPPQDAMVPPPHFHINPPMNTPQLQQQSRDSWMERWGLNRVLGVSEKEFKCTELHHSPDQKELLCTNDKLLVDKWKKHHKGERYLDSPIAPERAWDPVEYAYPRIERTNTSPYQRQGQKTYGQSPYHLTTNERTYRRNAPLGLEQIIIEGREADLDDLLDARGLTPQEVEMSIKYAVSEFRPTILSKIIQFYGVDADVLNRALIDAVLWDNREAIRLLVGYGASNIDEAVNLARRYGKEDIVRDIRR